MRKEYDFSKMKGRKNPYAKKLKKQITLRVGVDVLEYFKGLAEETGIPYQNLIDMYLRDCVLSKKRPSLKLRPRRRNRSSSSEWSGSSNSTARSSRKMV